MNFNQIVVGIPFATVAYYILKVRGFDNSRQLPTFHWVMFELIVCILLEEVGFYYTHRYSSKHNNYYKYKMKGSIAICQKCSVFVVSPLAVGIGALQI